ncbi:CGNR zinc finger domain-containing protein [Micromonospora foliorum]|uniref:CGNR zinc finger domain-containing protein n=1 Tax=Micromonospora foliorum TaxID=2911210 RepID=UPI001EE84E62|nr:CGNR zinc finger domain-containing protein [Micromonospora foliorum]MCG5435957.1 CGNR zinc finger domain-containing protein [Micromonospora foliorum]
MTRRPLVGEPLALDLVNTQWVERGRMVDLFDEPDGLREWLAEHRLEGDPAAVETPLRQTRSALRRVLEQPDADSERAVNAILAHGASRYTLHRAAVHEQQDVDPDWLPSWRAAINYLDLLRQQPNRIRRCGNPACVLHFYDTSRNGTRRWCSMDGCGARAKAARHYQRQRITPAS